MSGFKLLGIRILEDCDLSIRKSLKEKTYYTFNSDYVAKHKDNNLLKEIIDIVPKQKLETPENLFSINDLDISISAVVGQNGSGKSTLLEIIYACSFLLGEKYEHIGDLKWKNKELNPNQYITNKEQEIANDLFSLKDLALFEVFFCEGEDIYKIINNGVRRIEIQKKEINEVSVEWNNVEDEKLSDAFYSICVNYSLYGLNERNDPWLRSLFHKNDGYKTPLVINPYRQSGNIDVNRELHLAQTRTILNLSARNEDTPEIVNDKKVSKVRFVLDVEDNNHVYNSKGVAFEFKTVLKHQITERDLFKLYNQISQSLCGHSLSAGEVKSLKKEQELDTAIELTNKAKLFEDSAPRTIRVKYEMVKYTIRKVLKICVQYSAEYGEFLFKDGDDLNKPPVICDLNGLLEKLTQDKSHITLKLRQILYSVFSKYFEKEGWYKIPYYKEPNNAAKKSFALELDWKEVQEMVNTAEERYGKFLDERMEVVPAALVKPELYIENKLEERDYGFRGLSSGEQQLANTIQTIVYHLYNLNSVHGAQDDNRLKYKLVNIIFDEVELYFHPEFQRIFISELIAVIRKARHNNLDGINIIFSTHSPFILSDIPSSNILRLKNGKPTPEEGQTFGANIHQLLHNDFYLENGFIGEFAKSKIEEVVDFLRMKKWTNDIKNINKRIKSTDNEDDIKDLNIQLEIIQLQRSRVKQVNESLDIDKCQEIIGLVGEPVLSESLNQLLTDVQNLNLVNK